jgi:polyhydroxybutyrate depolymerase
MLSSHHSFSRIVGLLAIGMVSFWLVACESSKGGGSGSGGSDGTGGSLGSGGKDPNGSGGQGMGGAGTGGRATRGTGTGGSSVSGGQVGSGGATGSGGGSSTGGAVGSGGKTGTGGSGTGGAIGTGGTPTTGGTTGGGAAPGGSVGTGGAATGGTPAGGRTGTGGAGTGGSSGTSTSPPGDPVPSAGCSATPTTTSCNTQNAPCTLNINGTARTFYVQLPDSYQATTPYPVVFQYHPLGGNGWQGLTMYQIRPNFPHAIYVSPDGLSSGGNQGFANTNGGDEALTRAMMTDLETKYCVDKARYFATGFSYGGSMSYTAACNMSDVFRAIGAAAGAPISGATCTTKTPQRPVAVWATHGDADTALPITMAQPIIDAIVKNNGCTTTTQPVDPSPVSRTRAAKQAILWCGVCDQGIPTPFQASSRRPSPPSSSSSDLAGNATGVAAAMAQAGRAHRTSNEGVADWRMGLYCGGQL